MQKVNIVCVGKLKESYWRDAITEYSKRLSRFCKVTIKELPECKTLQEESVAISRAVTGFKIALCVEGKKLSSENLAEVVKTQVDRGSEITFIIGSSTGLDEQIKSNADLKLSFSDMTFPHQLMRVILLEQIYRAFMINAGSEYHK